MILVISQAGDTPAEHVARRAQAQGVEVVWFNPAEYPGHAHLSWRCDGGRSGAVLRRGSEALDLEHVRVAWYRRPEEPAIPEDVQPEAARHFARLDCRHFIDSLWRVLRCHWVPGPFPQLVQAERKLFQLQLAQTLGFAVPETLVTNDPTAFLDFYRAHDGAVVSKLLGIGMDLHFPEFARYTQFVTPRDVAYFRTLGASPVIFQAYVPKHLEIRVTVVGERIFAAEIHSQATRRTQHDWRRYTLGRTPHLPHRLPREISEQCLVLVQRLGLCFGAIDLVLTPDGQYVFLEINPNGQWQWIENLTGLPISEALCDLLVHADQASEASKPVLAPAGSAAAM